MSAEVLGGNEVCTANHARPRGVWTAFWERAKTIGKRNVSCLGALWPGDTVNPKRYGFHGIAKTHWKTKQNQQFDWAGKDTINCWRDGQS
mgnify:CR=1 FL=1